MNHLASRIAATARATRNYGATHLFLGSPRSYTCDKTAVEPGNNFSPGIGSFGVSLWIESGDELTTPDLLNPAEIEWTFGVGTGDGPVVTSRYVAGEATVENRIGQLGSIGANGVDFVAINVTPTGGGRVTAAVVVRDEGPAGRKIESIAWDDETTTLVVNGAAHMVFEQSPVHLEIVESDAEHDSPIAVLLFGVECATQIAYRVIHGFGRQWIYRRDPVTSGPASYTVNEGFAAIAQNWAAELPARVHCPDDRVVQAYEASAYHVLAAMESGLPRISVLNYPIFWIRDCVIVLKVLDAIGRPELARIGCDYLAPLTFGGGFGAEGDNPGEGIWALVNHAEATGDVEWLRSVYPTIVKRVEWIERMMTATGPIGWVTENRTPEHAISPDDSTLCLASNQGTIVARMDNHLPVFYVNCWNAAGLRRASDAARLVGDAVGAAKAGQLADALEAAVIKVLLPDFGGNERDAIATPHPTGALPQCVDTIRERFAAWSKEHMLWAEPGDTSDRPWPYFDCAMAHNAIILGHIDIAWKVLDKHLEESVSGSIPIFQEGYDHERLPYNNGGFLRGWLRNEHGGRGNMPHNWAHGEMVLLIRAIFVRELPDGRVALGEGIRPEWLAPGQSFGVTDMPTKYGPVTYTVTTDAAGNRTLAYSGPADPQLSFTVDEIVAVR
ncbi:MAG TPA: hypothetical protein VGK19_18455 [Capsulimonadaceae bacterium]